MFLTPLKAGSMSGDENFISGRKLPWIRAHTLPTVNWATAQPPPDAVGGSLLAPQSSLPRCLMSERGRGSLSLSRHKCS